MSDFTTAFTVERTPRAVFEAITIVGGWWSQEVQASPTRSGQLLQLHPRPDRMAGHPSRRRDLRTGRAEVRFAHVGLAPQYECYEVCSNAWGGYLGCSLRNLINTGEGQPNLKEAGDAPAHQQAASVLRSGSSPCPNRPSVNWKGQNHVGTFPASTEVIHRPVDLADHARLAASIAGLPPGARQPGAARSAERAGRCAAGAGH